MGKQFVAIVGMVAGLLSASAGVAVADGHNVGDPDISWPCKMGKCKSSGAAWGSPDGAQVRDPSWTPAINQGDLVPAVQAIDTSTDSPHSNVPVASYPAAPVNLPPSSWPGSGWGVDDR
jgi:hypothetical protein